MIIKAIQITEFGGPEVLRLADVPVPGISPTDILVRTEAIGVNFIDTYYREGVYPTDLPFIPGDEASGVVVEVGTAVSDIKVGDRVAWTSPHGSYAEFVAVPAAAAVIIPEGLSPDLAASCLAQGMTAHYLAHSTYEIQPSDHVLIHAGAGGVGLLLTQMAAARGATVITTVSSPEKAKLSTSAGAAHVLDYGPQLAQQVRELTDGQGVAASYDGVGAATFRASLDATRARGTVVLFGAASGPVPPLDPQELNKAGSLFLTRPTISDYTRDRAELLWRAESVLRGIQEEKLSVTIGGRYALADAAQAHRDLQERRSSGALVLIP
ncbi:quinone oxidoreductase [Glutamicibacter uratoxydans]|uniref:Quinone oxidoreductase n=1 Tax=Glutamicibacter uratoxydans TaxID=43667 RepID=A0A4Y4DKF0_GLUUR|nr:quinone oxidoreductase [Glutamicibacter uratoxydans]GED05063.1 quinone oxidoreductase [Glutamicibacter uratoxydans]